jgi:hypothetical protein
VVGSRRGHLLLGDVKRYIDSMLVAKQHSHR